MLKKISSKNENAVGQSREEGGYENFSVGHIFNEAKVKEVEVLDAGEGVVEATEYSETELLESHMFYHHPVRETGSYHG